MPETLNTPAKILKPKLASVYSRGRLNETLDRARDRSLIWIVAPPGAGKTTLIADYLSRRKLGGIWYQVDSGDSDIATFFHYMTLSAEGVKARSKKKNNLPRFTPDCLPGLDGFARRFFESAFERLKAPFVVVLDNYQEVGGEAKLHAVVRASIDQLPRRANLVVISRNEPPEEFARLRVNNAMAIIDFNELRLTFEEAQGLAKYSARAELTDAATKSLYVKAQGWIAGMVLMLQQVSEAAPAEPTDIGTPRVLFDYFAGEIFEKTDQRTQETLLTSAFLPRMTLPMLIALTGDSEAARVIKEMNRRSYFTENHAGEEPVYQYHPLMREFLLNRAQATFSEKHLTEIKRRAADLLAEAGEFEDAIDLLSKIEAWPAMAELIIRCAQRTVAQGRSQTLHSWISKLPEDLIERTPWLLYWQGMCRFPFDPPAGRACFERAFARFKARNDLTGIFVSWSGVVEAIVHHYTELTLLDHWIATLEGLIHEHPQFPSIEVETRVSCNMFLALVFRQLHHPKIKHWMERATELSLKCSELNFRLYIFAYSMLYHAWMGNHAQAGDALDRLHKALNPEQVSPLVHVGAHVVSVVYQLYRTTSSADIRMVEAGLEVAKATGVHIWDATFLAEGAGIAMSAGDLKLAQELLDRSHAVVNESRRMDACLFHFFSAWLAILRDDLPSAFMHAESSLAHSVQAGSVNLEERNHILLSQILHARGDREAAWTHLDQARRLMQRRGDSLTEFVCALTEADLCLEEGQNARAVEALRRALPLGKRNGYINFYTWRHDMMARLCGLALVNGIEPAYAKQLIRQRGLMPDDATDTEHWPWPLKIYTLGRFALVRDDQAVNFSAKAQHKPLALMKVLIALGGRDVTDDALIEALWPDTEGDAAIRALHTTLHRLRRIIGSDKALVVNDRKLSVDRRSCWVDAWAFERMVNELDQILKEPHDGRNCGEVATRAERAVSLYRGYFLGQETDLVPAISLRARLHDKFRRVLHSLGDYWERTGEWEKLAGNYQKALDADDKSEEIYQRLMLAYRQLGRHAEALSIYDRCRRILTSKLGTLPSAATEEIRSSLKATPGL